MNIIRISHQIKPTLWCQNATKAVKKAEEQKYVFALRWWKYYNGRTFIRVMLFRGGGGLLKFWVGQSTWKQDECKPIDLQKERVGVKKFWVLNCHPKKLSNYEFLNKLNYIS